MYLRSHLGMDVSAFKALSQALQHDISALDELTLAHARKSMVLEDVRSSRLREYMRASDRSSDIAHRLTPGEQRWQDAKSQRSLNA